MKFPYCGKLLLLKGPVGLPKSIRLPCRLHKEVGKLDDCSRLAPTSIPDLSAHAAFRPYWAVSII